MFHYNLSLYELPSENKVFKKKNCYFFLFFFLLTLILQKVLRTVFGAVSSRDYHQRNKLQALFKPVVDSIIVKCTDGNR